MKRSVAGSGHQFRISDGIAFGPGEEMGLT